MISIWVLPITFAVTFHEAAHGYVARVLGDYTASRLGRVTLNPLKHVDPVGTILIPALLLLSRSPFLFGYARPVPVNFRALRQPRVGMALVALAGPAMNIVLAFLAAWMLHLSSWIPSWAAQWVALNLKNALVINVFLAIFNMLPIPPLDGGRVAVAILPRPASGSLARLEPYGLLILIAVLFVVPIVGRYTSIDLGAVPYSLQWTVSISINLILHATGHL